jgi:translation initiation factor 3 subunit I
MCISTDPFMGVPARVHIVNVAANREEQTNEIVASFGDGVEGRINRALWGPLNETILTGGEDGVIRAWDVETGKIKLEARDHKKQIQHLCLSEDKTHFVSASLDKMAKLFDSETLECLKTYVADRPVNAAIISPILDHIVLGGGQDAMAVTTTSSKAGKFDSKIYFKVYEEEIGSIRGHFGPVNALAFNPDGRSFTTGGEDGYSRVHHLDNDYFRIR